MNIKARPRRRRHISPALALSTALAVSGGLAIEAVNASAATVDVQRQVSQNWAGYVVQGKAGQSFTSVSGSWTQPSASASSGQGYSAFWVGLGGAGQGSQALEQVGTSSDVVDGQPRYYAWYELVPAPETKLNLPIQAGDRISAKVTVTGDTVTVSLSDETTGQSITKALHTNNTDTTSAEWIAEAPSTDTQDGAYQTLPLANFGTATFTNASATAGDHTGSISDPDWSVEQVELSPAGSSGYPGAGAQVSGAGLGAGRQAAGGARPSSLSSDGSSFSVSYAANGGAMPSSTSTGGYSGAGDPGAGYGYSGGYDGGDGGGYSGAYDGGGYSGAYDDGGGYGYSGGGPWVIVF